ncbi:MAG: peptidoglycan-binding protein [Oscillospiraceae bacterium]|nr:peptidoglycan-binding protein [Oscillospiraceae bacterium]
MTGEPFIPKTITVHLGAPDESAADVTVPFPEYIKNVASSEIYPTWPENALRANIYAIVSFALNRVYTEWYRSRGYPFDITSVTQYDQKYIEGREIYDNISRLVDELFDDYIRRDGNLEPLFAAFCNGTTVTCAGLSQWGTVDLAKRGLTPYEILQNYYGEDIVIVKNAPVRPNLPSYPGEPLGPGASGPAVQTAQIALGRIAWNYPALPKIGEANGQFDAATADAVRAFQRIFDLPETGIIDKATWYKIEYIYTSVKHLAELDSEGIAPGEFPTQYQGELSVGSDNEQVRGLQYFLAVVGAYYEDVLPIEITGEFDEATRDSVRSFQRIYGLPQTGTVDEETWNALYRAYAGIVESIPSEASAYVPIPYPGTVLQEGMTSDHIRILQEYLTYIHDTIPSIPAVRNTGYFGPITRSAVLAYQRYAGLNETGAVGAVTWDGIAGLYADLRFGSDKRPYQAPGYTIRRT